VFEYHNYIMVEKFLPHMDTPHELI